MSGSEGSPRSGSEGRSERIVYYVSPDGSGAWKVHGEGAAAAISVHWRKEEAVDKAREIAQQHEPSQVIIKRRDGKIEEERTYGSDPQRSRG